jgi:NADPH:quinone reductase-like Zn-dependent oxidoreductase
VGIYGGQAVVDLRRVVFLPDVIDPLKVAAAMNPAMSSWVALRHRVPLQPGQSVLVLGATGNAGGMAVQVAKRLGASRVVGAGRNPQRLAGLAAVGVDAVVALSDDPDVTGRELADAAADVDVVVDYLWGQPAATAMMALLRARADRSRAMDWIQIGAIAGATLELPSVALRSANLRIQGNGQGAVSTEVYLAELPSLVEEIEAGTIAVKVHPVALADVETAWRSPDRAGRANRLHTIGPLAATPPVGDRPRPEQLVVRPVPISGLSLR